MVVASPNKQQDSGSTHGKYAVARPILPLPTPRQFQVLEFVAGFRKEFAHGPTYAEIGRHFGFSEVAAFKHVGELIKAELVSVSSRHRSMRVTPMGRKVIRRGM